MGFQVVEGLAADGKARWAEKKAWNALSCRLDEGTTLVKPLTYVNRTGETAEAIVKKESARVTDCLFVCDDANLDFGKIRLRASGSAGGHHGLESVIARLEDSDFPRLRLGIRNPEMPGELPDFVLGKFSPVETKSLEKILATAREVCRSWATEDVKAAMEILSRRQSVQA